MKTISNRKAWLYLPLLLILFMVASYFSYSSEPKQYPSYAIDSPSPTGIKAIYTYLSKEMDVKKWSHTPYLLGSETEKQLLIMAEPYKMPKTEEIDDYLRFIEAGHTILLLKENPKDLFNLNTILAEDSSSKITAVNSHNINYRAEISSPFRLNANEKEDIILFTDDKGIIALKRPIGKGELIVSTAPEWITNEKITEYDHTKLVLTLLNEASADTILFDQYIQGGEKATSILTLYPKWFLLLMLQSFIIVLLFLWQNGKRFGPIYVPREETIRFSDERIRALAFWYIKGSRYHDSLCIQADFVKILMQERWGIPYNKQWKDLTDALMRKWSNMPQSEINTFLNGLTFILANERINKQEYLLWSKKLEWLRKEVEDK